MKKTTTIYTLAKELGMTPSMVSRALSPDGKVEEEKRRRVLEAAKRHGYTPNRFASRLSMRTLEIGILIAGVFAPVTDELCLGIREAYEQLKDYKIDYRLTVLDPSPTPEALADQLSAMVALDGVVLSGFGAEEYTPVLTAFAKQQKNIVVLQNGNESLPRLATCAHDPSAASALAAEFLYHCLRRSSRKNLLLFTGDLASPLHRKAAAAFREEVTRYGMTLLAAYDMKDSTECLSSMLPSVLAAHREQLDGIYITSGNSTALCEAVKDAGLDIDLVTFDLYPALAAHLADGTVTATVFQNLREQAAHAFTLLAEHLVSERPSPPTVYSEVKLLLAASLKQLSSEV